MADGGLLAAAIDIHRWLEADRQTPYEERLARDRELGRSLGAGDARQRVFAWWARVGGADGDLPGARVAAGRRLASSLLFGLGLLLGGGLASAALAYDGSAPINLLTLLGLLVAVPALLFLFTMLALPGWLPGVRALADLFAGMSPGRWAGAWLDRLGGTSVFTTLANVPGGRAQRSALARWQTLTFSQLLAVAFFLGVLAVCWLRVVFSDLAFGWSTTLDVDGRVVHELFVALSLPWAVLVPAAVPELALTEASRFVRLEDVPVSGARAEQLGGWWPFVIMTVLVYGLLPRLVLLLFGRWRLTHATRRWLLESAEVTALLDRLSAPAVDYAAAEGAGAAVGADAQAAQAPAPAADLTTEAIVWNDALSPEATERWLRSAFAMAPARVHACSTLLSADERQGVLEDLGTGLERLAIVTKGWEPPVLEFLDFVEQLRGQLGPEAALVVLPVAVGGNAIEVADREIWATALGRLDDGRVYVMDALPGAGEGTP